MTKSELIEELAKKANQADFGNVEAAVKVILDLMSDTLARGGRIEIRGFGCFSLNYCAPRLGRNPKTGESIRIAAKCRPHFKPGKELKIMVNESRLGAKEEQI